MNVKQIREKHRLEAIERANRLDALMAIDERAWLDELAPWEKAELFEAQASQPRYCIAADGPRCEWPTTVGWVSVAAEDAIRLHGMVPESALYFYNIPDEDIDGLWEQAGREWHHIRVRGRLTRERFFRAIQVQRYGSRIVF